MSLKVKGVERLVRLGKCMLGTAKYSASQHSKSAIFVSKSAKHEYARHSDYVIWGNILTFAGEKNDSMGDGRHPLQLGILNIEKKLWKKASCHAASHGALSESCRSSMC